MGNELKQKIKCYFGYHEIYTMNSTMNDHVKELLIENPMTALRYSNTLSTKRCKHCKRIDL